MRQFTACIAASAIALGATAFSAPARAADDMGSNPVTELFNGLGLSEREKPDIDYRERAPLVPPTSASALPAPQAKGAAHAGQQWPNDPDAAARAERKRRDNVVPTETYSYQMDRSPRVDPDELISRRTAGASVPRTAADSTRGDNEITRSSRDELSGKIIRTVEGSGSGRPRLTDPPPAYLEGNGVTAQAAPEQKPWYARLLGAN